MTIPTQRTPAQNPGQARRGLTRLSFAVLDVVASLMVGPSRPGRTPVLARASDFRVDVWGWDVGVDAPHFRYHPECGCGWRGDWQWVQLDNAGLLAALVEGIAHTRATGHTIGTFKGHVDWWGGIPPWATPYVQHDQNKQGSRATSTLTLNGGTDRDSA